ncbi:MAG: hypothetical protein CL670_03550 [Balneola sp.]|mgnify:FL=1|nr:hypothetical protein [Balneola sp.]MBE78205.1 hypothetical protein [Balneola sp.]
MELYWTVLAACLAGFWALVTRYGERKRMAIEDNRSLVNRLLTSDQLLIEHPEVIKYISATALEKEEYFRDQKRLEEDLFYKAKSHIYSQLNLYDEILCTSNHNKAKFFFINSPAMIEVEDWEEYMKCKMTHPFIQSILNNEAHIFGKSLQTFWNVYRKEITGKTTDRFSW